MTAQELDETLDQLYEAYDVLRRELQRRSRSLYNRWADGGYTVDDRDPGEKYPTFREAINQLITRTREEELQFIRDLGESVDDCTNLAVTFAANGEL